MTRRAARPGRSLAALKGTLRDVFGAEDFRPGQQQVIRSALSGRNTVAVMPTGAGKSLCYQLPAVHLPGMTLVASPLISLMKDQIDKLSERDLEVRQTASEAEKQRQLVELLRGIDGSGIVYASTLKHVDTAAAVLRAAGIETATYHGRMNRNDRRAAQDRFMRGDVPAMVATNAFGMGVDKGDIRFVVHYNMPGSLDSYYQESGRGGRDGHAARCVLLYQVEDRRTQLGFIKRRRIRTDTDRARQSATS